ncbi:unnamed protein product [Angiostrongylus costaricensis]|uniref:SCP domain-containing protein n=1 Tax=Angiostrongylus costaricensis TaxID=334426 RepID=A0A0R3PBR9_ANGCS|nr:unnamed protein product [Angiostrongylus costaricensis]
MWNCNLERSAEAAVVNCPQNQPTTGSQNAMNYLSFGPGMPPSVPSNPIESAVLKWVEINSVVWPTDNRFNGNSELRDFANEYDCGAEQLALDHVKSCDRQLSPPTSRPGYKENIHILETTATDVLGALQNAVAMWNKELEANGIPSNLLLTPQIFQRQQKTVTNVAKILWGTNKYVGCATQLCSGFYFTSCMYRKP